MKILLIALLCCFGQTVMSQSSEEKLIIQLLEKEAASWRAADFKVHSSCWHIQPYSRILVSVPGNCYDVPPASMLDPATKLGNGGFAVLSNIKMNITGNTAWVSHDEVSTSVDGKESYSHELRIVEKINGEWKLVGQSIHVYNK